MKIFKAIQKWSLLVLFTVLSISCSEEKMAQPNDYDLANNMITKGQYDTAIASMNEKVSRNPQDAQARLILASAFAARASIFMREYYAASEAIIAKIREAEAYLNKNSLQIFNQMKRGLDNNEQLKLIDSLEKTFRALYQANQVLNIWNSLPTPTTEQWLDVKQAVMVLDADKQLTGGPALYRGVLRIVYFKGEMKHNFKYAKINQCYKDSTVAQFLRELTTVQSFIVAILQDLIMGTNSLRLKQELARTAQKLNTDFFEAIRAIDDLQKSTLPNSAAIKKALTEAGCEL